MGSYYEDRGELVETERVSFEINGTKYRISAKIRHKNHYHIYVGLYKIEGSTPYDRLFNRRMRAEKKDEIENKARVAITDCKKFAEDREDAKTVSINIELE